MRPPKKAKFAQLVFILMIAYAYLGANTPSKHTNLAWEFWAKQRKGFNQFNKRPTGEAWYKAAKANGAEWIRLAFGKRKEFLLGDYDNYKKLVKQDLAEIKQALDYAHAHGLKVVLVPISLPGAKFRQLRGGKNDMRLFKNKIYWNQSATFWQDLALALKDHPALVAYNLMNEPYGEYQSGFAEHKGIGDTSNHEAFANKYRGNARDVRAFSAHLIKAIRQVDPKMPIMVESGWYAQPNAFVWWKAFDDPYILYQFHMYEPYAFTSGSNFRNKKGYTYPGKIPFGGKNIIWDKAMLQNYLKPFAAWIKAQNIKPNQIVVGEFGCMRRNKGCEAYLGDLIGIFNKQNYHWALYSFREDEWDGYDYELGAKGLGWKYWKAKEQGKNPPLPRNSSNPLWQVIKQEIRPAH